MASGAPTPHEVRNAELRRPYYRDVEALLSPGFLSQPFTLGSTACCMRTPSPGDFLLLRARVGRQPSDRDWMEWAIATCTWMVEGQVLLEDSRAVVKIRQTLKNLKTGAIKTLFALFQSLHARVGAALERMEAYCYENHSRGLWRMCNRQNPGRDEFTGIPGTGRLGMNNAQRLWVAYNLAEDERIADMADWSAAKLVASAQSPKGIKKLNASDQRRHQREQDRRKRVMDQMYWEAVGDHEQAQRRKVVRAVTPTELIEDMRKWVAGERDEHDKIVAAQKKLIQERFEAEKREREQRRRMLEAQQSLAVGGGKELVGYKLEDLSKLTRDRPGGPRRQTTRVFEGGDPRRLYHKYIAQDASSGRLAAGDDGVVTRTQTDMNTKLRERKVTIRSEGGE